MDEQRASESVDEESVDDAEAAPWPSARPLDTSKVQGVVTPVASRPRKNARTSDTKRDISKRGDALLFPEHVMGHQDRVILLELMLARSDAPVKINLRTVGSYIAAIDREFDLLPTTGAVLQGVITDLAAQKKVLPTNQWGTWVNTIGRVNKDRVEQLIRSLRSHVVFLYGRRGYQVRGRGAPARMIREWISDPRNVGRNESGLMRRVVHALVRAAENPDAYRLESEARKKSLAPEMEVLVGEDLDQKVTEQEARELDEELIFVRAWRPKLHRYPQAAAVRVTLQLMLSLMEDQQPQRRFMLLKWARMAAAEVGFVADKEAGHTEVAILLGLLRDLIKFGHAKVIANEGISFQSVPTPDEIELARLNQIRDKHQEQLKREERERERAERMTVIAAKKQAEQPWFSHLDLEEVGKQAGKAGVFTYVRDGVEAFDARNGAVRGIPRGTWSGAKSKAQALRGKTFALRASTDLPAQGLLHPAPAPVEVVPRRITRAEIEATQSRKLHGNLVPSTQAQPSAEPSSKALSEISSAGAPEDKMASLVSEHRARRLRQLASRRTKLQVVPVIVPPQEDGGLGMLDLINKAADIKPRV